MSASGPSVLVRRCRDFRALWIGETTSAVGTNVSRVALPLLAVVVLGASTFQVALLTAAGWAPWLLLGLPAGAWVDRLTRCRPLLLACNVLSAALLLSVPVRAWMGELTLTYLLGFATDPSATCSRVWRTWMVTGRGCAAPVCSDDPGKPLTARSASERPTSTPRGWVRSAVE